MLLVCYNGSDTHYNRGGQAGIPWTQNCGTNEESLLKETENIGVFVEPERSHVKRKPPQLPLPWHQEELWGEGSQAL